MRRKLLIAAVTVGLLALTTAICMTPKSGASAYSLDKRIKVYDVRYFPGTNIDYSYLPPSKVPQYQLQRLLQKLGAHYASWWISPTTVKTGGPGMVIYGRAQIKDASAVELVSEKEGTPSSPAGAHPGPDGLQIWLWLGRFNDDTYHLRCVGETNDLALIHLR